MSRLKDLTGMKFGKLTAIKIVGRKNRRALWKCKCECGNTTYVISNSLISGNTKSCGCDRYVHTPKYGNKTAHKQRLYNIWCGIKDRCFNANNSSYMHYGGRGITMCKEWADDYMSFRYWAYKSGYSDELTIDRVNPNGNYTPNNCRWADMVTQANNRTNSHYLSFNGRTMTIAEWAKAIGMNESTIRQRIWRGWEPGKALTTPARGSKCHRK